jgi:hypothetical protein
MPSGDFFERNEAKLCSPINMAPPQVLNSYTYAAGNPITGIDADGRLVELVSRPLTDPNGGQYFAHTFLRITPENPNTIGSISGIDTTKSFTLSGYDNQGTLTKIANWSYDAVGNCNSCSKVRVAAPIGVSGEDFERGIASSFNSMPNELANYSNIGQPQWTGRSNSNNAATSYLMGGGVSQMRIQLYQIALTLGNAKLTPGLGQPIGSNQQSQATRFGQVLSQLASVLTTLQSAINSTNPATSAPKSI